MGLGQGRDLVSRQARLVDVTSLRVGVGTSLKPLRLAEIRPNATAVLVKVDGVPPLGTQILGNLKEGLGPVIGCNVHDATPISIFATISFKRKIIINHSAKTRHPWESGFLCHSARTEHP